MPILINEIVGGILAILGVVIGAKVTSRAADEQAHQKLLMDCYANVFAKYYMFLADTSDDNLAEFATAAERARLICCPESEKLLAEITPLLAAPERDTAKIVPLFNALRESAKKDTRDYYRKHRH